MNQGPNYKRHVRDNHQQLFQETEKQGIMFAPLAVNKVREYNYLQL
jgi:hypothetical protein